MQPLVSIILPCYNAEKYLHYSIQSILMQDYKNLEILCINDGSSDSTLKILNECKDRDKRIVIINNETNQGLINSLNNTLKLVKGVYFARMDADDYSTPDRISRQVEFMYLNPEIDLVSSAYNYFEIDGRKRTYVPPISQGGNSLKLLSLFCTPLTHASILGRKSLISSGIYYYDKDYPYAEDFELFSRIAWKNVKMANIKEPLYWVRLHSNSVSIVYNDIQLQTNLKISRRNLLNFCKSEDLTSDILCLVTCRVKNIVKIQEIVKSFFLIDQIVNKLKSTLTNKEMTEVNDYVNLHKLNILVQVNKVRFKSMGLKNIVFFVRTLFFLNIKKIKLLLFKLIKSQKYFYTSII